MGRVWNERVSELAPLTWCQGFLNLGCAGGAFMGKVIPWEFQRPMRGTYELDFRFVLKDGREVEKTITVEAANEAHAEELCQIELRKWLEENPLDG